ncbi:hypothetical protein SAMN04487926_15513 [Paraburkholderia steynii]|uniref:DUF2471 domain-containing protein n=1 Tax=Paraburkholderia steynii TaxID=1245441 RepID=A0A7Z7FP90_9BURK|nr:hypothetical protein [Paraburkholderia steynii]SDJ49104.1 hypothetical protein SAMN04487926_15513 [Paraburkholderia steynii]
MTVKLDEPNRADLLCHLVVAQLIARARTGDWLRTDHLVDAKNLWAMVHDAAPDWLESAQLAHVSVQIAATVWTIELLREADQHLPDLFDDGWKLNYSSPIVHGIHAICVARLGS